MFDVKKLTHLAAKALEDFAANHQDETFYAVTIDAGALKMNSIEEHEESLAELRAEFPRHYQSVEEIDELKYNSGDWRYTIIKFRGESDEEAKENGFDEDLYNDHYDTSDEEQKTSEYRNSMEAILIALKERNAFNSLRLTEDFVMRINEHGY